MRRCNMMDCVDENNKIRISIKKKPKKNGYSTIKKLLDYLDVTVTERVQKADDDTAVETEAKEGLKVLTNTYRDMISNWNNVIHSREEEYLSVRDILVKQN